VYVGMELEVAFDDRSEVTVPLFRPVRAPVDADALDKERRS
jgi:hypothetical protein